MSRLARHAARVVLLLVLSSGIARAERAIGGDTERFDLTGDLEILQDPERALTIEDAARREFEPLAASVLNSGYSNSAYFIRIRLFHAENGEALYYLAPYRGFERIDLYRARPDGGFDHAATGSGVALGDRAVYDRAPLLEVPLHAGEHATLFLRLETGASVRFYTTLWSRRGIERQLVRDWSVIGLFYGAMLALLSYNLFMFVSLRDPAYLYYALFHLGIMFHQASNDDLTHSWLWPAWPRWRFWNDSFFAHFALAGAAGFTRSFLDLKKTAPPLDRWMRVLFVYCVVMALLFPLSRTARFQELALGGLLIVCASVAVCGVQAWRRGSLVARFFVAGWSLLLSCSFVSVMVLLGVVQTVWSPEDALRLGAVSEALLLSFGLAARVDELRRQRDRADLEWRQAQEARLEALGRLVAGVAHEIGNPFNFSAGGAIEVNRRLEAAESSLVATPPDVERARQALGNARRAAALVTNGNDRIRTVLTQLRSYGGGAPTEPEPIDVTVTIERTLELVSSRLEQQSIRIVRDLVTVPPVSCRAGELDQVLMNLVLNGCQAMPEGGALRIGARLVDGWVELQVSDDGPGIPPEHRQSIFDPFFTTRAPSEGAGLGLAVSREIVRRYGGDVVLLSSTRGACFAVRLRPRAS